MPGICPPNGSPIPAAGLRTACLLVALFLLSLSACGRSDTSTASVPATRSPSQPTEQTLPAPQPVRLKLANYVGSQVCAECHQEISERYATHPMARSATLVKDEPLAMYAEPGVIETDGVRFEVHRRGDEVIHHEIAHDSQGRLLYDREIPVKYGIGSATRGRSYISEPQPGVLLQSPIGWYASRQMWDLSPGYDAEDSRRFSRRITARCLACHTGRPELMDGQEERVAGFKELAIGCENCHGPGREHVAMHRGQLAGVGDPIVNPIELDPERRDAVCNRCHLSPAAAVPRQGHGWLSFQPGQLVREVLTNFTSGVGVVGEQQVESVSHVVQMQASVCFKESDRALSCISCHDPHGKPSPEEQVAFYRESCLECHADEGCALPEPQRLERQADDSCIACHMPRRQASDVPHTAQTDHRILRQPAQTADATPKSDATTLTFFRGADEQLQPWERDRAIGLALIDYMRTAGISPPVQTVASHLMPVLEKAPHDTLVLASLGTVAQNNRSYERARTLFLQALEQDPKHEDSLAGLVVCAWHTGRYAEGLEYMERLEAINRQEIELYLYKAMLLRGTGQLDAACEAAEYGLTLNPSWIALRRWLVEAYKQGGRAEEARRHEEFLRRLIEMQLD